MTSSTPTSRDGDHYAGTLQTMLRADVRVQAPMHAVVHRFEHFESSGVNVVRTAGDPMRVANAASVCESTFAYRMVSGRCRMRHATGEVIVRGGEFVAFHGSHALSILHEQPYEMIGVRLPAALLRCWLPEWDVAEFTPVAERCTEGQLLFEMADDLLRSGPRLDARSVPIFSEAMTRLLAHALADGVAQVDASTTSRADRQRRRVRQFCRRHLASPGLDVAAIGRAVGLSPAHLHRLFAGEPLTLMAWIRAERLEASYAAIEAGPDDLHLLQLALSLGFRDAAHFSHAFRRRFGLSPRELRGTAH